MNSNRNPIEWALRPLSKYADFTGRAPRAEYWWFYLLSIITVIITMIIDGMIGSNFGGTGYGIVTAIAGLGLVLPSIAAGVRRLHDTDHSGWWMLIAFIPLIGVIVLLVFFVTEGTRDENSYGPNPYGEHAGT